VNFTKCAAVALAVCACSKDPGPEPPRPKEVQAVPAPPPKSARDQAEERAASVDSLKEAVSLALPLMTDTEDDYNDGTRVLSYWMGRHDFWKELQSWPDSKRVEVMKDSERWRGHRLCVSGTVNQITRLKGTERPLFTGIIVGGYVNATRFVAVGDTTGVNERSWARFCGVFTGVLQYSTNAGGKNQAPEVVGAFDLTARPAEEW
jgi:hypothetical protein